MEEQKVVEQCKQGSREAQHILYKEYAGLLFGICLRYLSSREAAEDLLHDGFIKIFSSINKFTYRGKGSLRAWLTRVMVNMAVEHLRKEKAFIKVSIIDNMEINSRECDYNSPNNELFSKVPREKVMELISKLPDGYRTVFNLFVIEGLSHREIANMLGINEKSSSSQLLRAKSALAKSINEYIKEKEL